MAAGQTKWSQRSGGGNALILTVPDHNLLPIHRKGVSVGLESGKVNLYQNLFKKNQLGGNGNEETATFVCGVLGGRFMTPAFASDVDSSVLVRELFAKADIVAKVKATLEVKVIADIYVTRIDTYLCP